jgi:hypothetical protein
MSRRSFLAGGGASASFQHGQDGRYAAFSCQGLIHRFRRYLDLTAELASEGLSWSQVGIDYEAVTDRLVALHCCGEVWALRLAQLSDLAVTLLASGPHTQIYVAAPEGGPSELLDPSIFQIRREELRAMIRADLEHAVATGRH